MHCYKKQRICVKNRKRGQDKSANPRKGREAILSIDDLPRDVWSIITSFLNLEDLRNLSLTKKTIYRNIRIALVNRYRWKIVDREWYTRNYEWTQYIRIVLVEDPYLLRETDLFTDIKLDETYNSSINTVQWPLQLQKLHLGRDFNQLLDLSRIPNLRNLHLGMVFNQPFDLAGIPNLQKLHLGVLFNRPLDLFRVPNLQELDLGVHFNQPLDLSQVPNLQKLHLGYEFNQPLDLAGIPNLQKLHLGVVFNRPLDLVGVPNLQNLHLGRDFNQPLDLSGILNLRNLHLGWNFNQPLDLSQVPNLQNLRLGWNFNQLLDLSQILNSQKIELSFATQRQLLHNIPQNVKIELNLNFE